MELATEDSVHSNSTRHPSLFRNHETYSQPICLITSLQKYAGRSRKSIKTY